MKIVFFGKVLQITISNAVVPMSAVSREPEDTFCAVPPKDHLKVGQRIKVNMRSGFHRGAEGEVVFVEPAAQHWQGGKVWVLRDGASSPVWFFVYELDKLNDDN